ncbi:MAG: hypothetical protein ACRDRO_21240, partial [Pseudonocardiaceae bacterium]
FEMLSLGIEGKASLWRSLIAVSDSHPALVTTDLVRLEKRAESQRVGLEERRIQVAREALSR